MNLYQQNNNIWFNQVEMGVKLQVTAFYSVITKTHWYICNKVDIFWVKYNQNNSIWDILTTTEKYYYSQFIIICTSVCKNKTKFKDKKYALYIL